MIWSRRLFSFVLIMLGIVAILTSAARIMARASATFIVNSTADGVDTNPGNGVCATAGGACTLRAAIQEANALAGADTISLPAGLYMITIGGTGEDNAAIGDLDLQESVIISGAGAPATIIDGGALDRVIHIHNNSIVNLSDMTIRNGNPGSDGGGGILVSSGIVSLSDSQIVNNTTTNYGGGIRNDDNLTLTRSTVSSNTALSGGGLYNGGVLTVTNSTLSSNSTTSAGGGISNANVMTVDNVTISHNSATYGDGVFNNGGSLALKNTIVANSVSGVNCSGLIVSNGHNLDSGNTCGFTAIGDLINTNPLLGPLQDNGGPTWTQALQSGSPAINAGDNAGCPATDQRGYGRSGICDIGAYEFNGATPTPTTTVTPTRTPTHTTTFTATSTRTYTPTRTHTFTPSNTPLMSDTPTITLTPSSTPSPTATATPTPTATPSGAITHTLYLPLISRFSIFVGPLEAEPNNALTQANGLVRSGQFVQGYPNDVDDYFSLYLAAPGVITVDVTSYTGIGGQVQLRDSANNLVGYAAGTSPFHIDCPSVAYPACGQQTGVYYVRIYTASGWNTVTLYSLVVGYP